MSVAMQQPSSCQGCKGGQTALDFTMALQPIVDLEMRTVVAHEALVRGLAGESARHVMAEINKDNLYAFDQACRTRAIGLASRLGLLTRLNINFLPNAVYEPVACIRATLAAAASAGFPPTQLTFEVVESEDLADAGHLRKIIETYRRIGFRIALDDFGSGYSGLARLADLRPDSIKVDRSLVEDCDHDLTRRAILGNILNLGRDIGVDVILEGVERIGEVEALRSIGGRFMQGFYFGRPAFEAMVSGNDIQWPAMAEGLTAAAAG
ncbi:EAL domain-containing protein [Acidisoma sp.]|uniref:EAL domain-containing protein n=1 Tax=Acidisoma sp. TaxID=1872115 RepID=UPI003AFF6BDD